MSLLKKKTKKHQLSGILSITREVMTFYINGEQTLRNIQNPIKSAGFQQTDDLESALPPCLLHTSA